MIILCSFQTAFFNHLIHEAFLIKSPEILSCYPKMQKSSNLNTFLPFTSLKLLFHHFAAIHLTSMSRTRTGTFVSPVLQLMRFF